MESEQVLSADDVIVFKEDSKLAFKELYLKHYHDLYYYGLKLSGSEEISKDCIQDLFIQFWSDYSLLSHVESKKAYLLKCLRRRIFLFLSQENKFSSIQDNFEHNIPSVSSPEEDLFNIESEKIFQHKLITAKSELSIRQQEVLFLKYGKGYSYSTICDIMDIKYQSVRNLLCEAVTLLRTKLESVLPS